MAETVVFLRRLSISIQPESLWCILRAYGMPQGLQQHLKCRAGNSKSCFGVKADVRRRCLMLTLLLDLTIDWVMRQTTLDRPQGIRWTLFSTLQDLDFSNDLVLISHTYQHMQEKTTRLGMFTEQAGLKISQKKTRVMMLNVSNPSLVTVDLDTSDLKSENIGLPDELCMLCWSTPGKIESLVLILLLVSIVF